MARTMNGTSPILTQLEYLRDVTDLNLSARRTLSNRTTELVLQGWRNGLSIKAMARALGVSPQAIRYRIPVSERPLAHVNLDSEE